MLMCEKGIRSLSRRQDRSGREQARNSADDLHKTSARLRTSNRAFISVRTTHAPTAVPTAACALQPRRHATRSKTSAVTLSVEPRLFHDGVLSSAHRCGGINIE